MKKQLLLLPLILFCCIVQSNAQDQGFIKRYINKIINDTSDAAEPQFLLYPTLAYSPETSWEIGFSSLYVYYANKDTSNRLSEINGFTFVTLEGQYGLWFDHANYSDKEDWFFLGRLRYQQFPLYYYGLGPSTSNDYLALVDSKQVLIKERVLRKLKKDFYLGMELDFNHFGSVSFEPNHPEANFDLPLGSEGSTNIGLGLGLVYDNRHNVLNVRKGLFSELAYIQYAPFWKGQYEFATIISDNRIYRPVGKNNVLAAQLFGQFNTGEVPFNMTSALGGESQMRGYYYGRYRDNNYISNQVEFRLLPIPLGFSKRFGAAAFAGAGTVFPDFNNLYLHKIVWSAGAGLRFLLFPKKDIYTRLDYAFGKDTSGFYIYIGEAF
ncbi:BamA/TamA family outer membrane protein [Echinicola marina]|uniref:BamA/TamA family outer membrane protein n=1 Tax=Echinicola marina TaxID=2859768 RepID=UPI001CF716F1|nr:BamA/TamA family outer membrane protein [Echinicola marina]UCS92470.1 BamA/TamA family outer membrane protein [Echinicola marina]